MSNTISINNFIKQLKAELESNNQDDGSDLNLSSAEVRLNFLAKPDTEDASNINFQVPIDSTNMASHEVTLTFSNKRQSDDVSKKCDVTVHENKPHLTSLDKNNNQDDFEGFKQRFEKNVKLKHGQTPKKKSIFED